MNATRPEADSEVTKLLEAYGLYNALLAQQQEVSSKLAKQKLKGDVSPADQASFDQLTDQLQQVSDSMTFASPTVWMRYKNEAYKDEAQPIKTMHDFRMHCSKPGYICTKRFLFVNEQLTSRHLPLLTDRKAYSDEVSLSELLTKDIFAVLEQNEDFMGAWATYEYHKENDRVAKWENYQS
jgi:hypothetical protein